MKSFILLFFIYLSSTSHAENFSKMIFKDGFNGKTLNKKWLFYTSASIQKDGKLICIMPEKSDHASFNYLNIDPIKDFEVILSFKFEGADYFNIGLMDRQYKGAHAGHICNAFFTEKYVTLREGKTGVFANHVRKQQKNGGYTPETKAMLKKKEKFIKYKFERGKWYNVRLFSHGSEMTLFVNDKFIGKLKSAGTSHETKRRLGLSAWGKSVHVDNFSLKTR